MPPWHASPSAYLSTSRGFRGFSSSKNCFIICPYYHFCPTSVALNILFILFPTFSTLELAHKDCMALFPLFALFYCVALVRFTIFISFAWLRSKARIILCFFVSNSPNQPG